MTSPSTHIEIKGRLRPRLNSLGQPIHPDEQGIINFWRWFGESLVVDHAGRPLVVYHGTAIEGRSGAGFTTFSKARCGEVTETSDAKLGFWFSSSLEVARRFASDALAVRGDGYSADLYEVYLRAARPWLAPRYAGADTRDLADPAVTARIIRQARMSSHDAVRLSIEGGAWVVFEPTQIKSATRNSGAFLPDSGCLIDGEVRLRARIKRNPGRG